MMLVALYFFLVEGDELVDWLDRVSPLRPGQTRELMTEFKRVTYAVIVSTVITAAVQAAAAVVGYLIARVPNPIFFGGLTFFVAFIPAVGAASVCLVAAGLLFVTGHPYAALFLAIWGVVVVGLVDNVVKPYLIKAGMQLRGGVVFFALIGGLGAFGTVGLLIGPLVVAALPGPDPHVRAGLPAHEAAGEAGRRRPDRRVQDLTGRASTGGSAPTPDRHGTGRAVPIWRGRIRQGAEAAGAGAVARGLPN